MNFVCSDTAAARHYLSTCSFQLDTYFGSTAQAYFFVTRSVETKMLRTSALFLCLAATASAFAPTGDNFVSHM